MKLSHIMSILTILTGLYVIRQSVKIKKYFRRYCLQCFSSKERFGRT